MRIYHFAKETSIEITNFNSKKTFFSRIIQHNKPIHIGCFHIGPEGVVGSHPATAHQLFLVLNGQGWVIGKEGIKYYIKSGMAAFWEPEEIHESGSEQGMTVIVIEGEDLKPTMNEIEWYEC
ncbi:cupin [Paenibacillus donghaensis]|uniref:cupin n=1 Tax=Paenibacillus donghaensis TaxID=414771 RepID=UPI001884181E|nr:cupin [Paenibacillus donghaensis]MBE9917101.1 cupin [Paenibacillus donghaensis]